MKAGTVTLVGAGLGDPELLTLKAVRAIGRATVLLVDDLFSDEVLAFAVVKRASGRARRASRSRPSTGSPRISPQSPRSAHR